MNGLLAQPLLSSLLPEPHTGFCYIYLRISDDKEGKELGVKRQEEDCRKLAAELGLIVVRVFCDNDKSASTNHDVYRPDYEEMMGLLETGPVKIVLTYTRKRLTRKPAENEGQIRLGRFHGVQYIYVRGEALDLTVSANRKIDRIQAALDAGEPEDLQELILRKKQEDAKHGLTPGGPRTYGYGPVVGKNPLNSKDIRDPYQTIPEEVHILHEGKRRTLAGDSQQLIVTDWNQRGTRTARAGDVIKYKGVERVCDGLWTVGKFSRTLLNESYVQFDPTGHPSDCPCLRNPETGGTRVHRNDRHRALWPAIFTRAEHEAMKAMFSHKPWSNHGRIKGRTYLLSGIVCCGGTWKDGDRKGRLCGGLMYGQGKTYKLADGSTKYQRRYACKKWDNHGLRAGCCTVFRIADPVEKLVSEAVLHRFDSPEIHRALAPTDSEDAMAAVLQTLGGLHARREQLAAEYAAGEHEKEDYHVMRTVIRANIAEAETEKKRLMSAKAKSLALPADGGTLRELWETASLEWRASVIKLVVERVIIHPGRPGERNWHGWNFDPARVEIVWLH